MSLQEHDGGVFYYSEILSNSHWANSASWKPWVQRTQDDPKILPH